MDDAEKQYLEELKAGGVELPDLPEAEKPQEKEPEAKPEEKSEEKPDDSTAPLQTPKEDDQKPEPRKSRSIYDVYKDEKSDRKAAETRAETAERERDELKQKVEELSKAAPGKDTTDAEKSLRDLAIEKGADPDFVERIIAESRKGLKPELDPNIKARLDRFEAWEKSNASAIEAQRFDQEFKSIVSSLKADFPHATDDELNAIRTELDTIAHSKEWHDKDLDYVAFKNKDKLSALVSPKKRGMEGKGKKDVQEDSFEFDPSADLSKMTPTERDNWEKAYRGEKPEGLHTDKDGKKTMI